VPLTDIAKPMFFRKIAATIFEIGNILKERCSCPAAFFPWSQYKLHHGYVFVDPQSKQLASLINGFKI
jgi:hypothetical protein